MDHAILTLEAELKLLRDCLSEWDCKNYPEARKERESKLKSCEKAILLLKLKKV